jgi:anti-sigma regulatory factor (Ser/Thr protein kinase)
VTDSAVVSIDAGLAAAHAARGVVRAWLGARPCLTVTIETAELLVTELVANAVRHAHADVVQLHLMDREHHTVRLAVDDGSPQPPTAPTALPDPVRVGGRGLWLVSQLASQWGWEPLPTGKRVWFEVPCR